MRYKLFFFMILYSICSFSQQSSNAKGKIEGVVVDVDTKEGIELATIKILSTSDSTFIQGASASHTGAFSFQHDLGKYILEFSMLGYQKKYREVDISEKNPTIELDTIFLQADGILLKEMEIVAQIPPMQIKGDTIEFNAGAFHSDGSSVLKDLIKQIPGLDVDENGNLKANGKAISKILIDGKEYFGNDIGMALSNIQANMITKLQLFEKESEEAKATGIKDEEPEQVLNLGVKEEFKKSLYGDTKSGIGNKGRHTNRANVNKMHGDNQYALVGDINNINDSEYGSYGSFDDNINKSIGTNFNIQESEKITINGSVQYDNYKTMMESASNSYTSILKQYSDRSNKGENKRQDVNTNATVDWKPDTLTTIYLRTGFGYNDGRNISNSLDSAWIENMSTTSSASSAFSESDGFRFNSSLMVSRRLNNKGRNISFNLSQNYNKDNSRGTNYSEKIYWENSDPKDSEVIDHVSKNDGKNTGYNFSVRYVEPLGKDNRLHTSYAIGVSNSNRINDVRKQDVDGEYTIIDPDYSRTTDYYSLRQNIRLGFQHRKEKYDFNINMGVDPSYTRNKTFREGKDPEDLPQNVVNYSPSARAAWRPNKNTYIDFTYNGSTNHPHVSQLSSVVVIHNSMSQTVGNPNLKPSFNNRFGLSYRKSDFESNRFLSASINYTYTFNSTVSFRTVDEHSNTVNSYRNVDGNSNAYAYVTFETPLRNKKINLGTVVNTSYNKNISFINDQENIREGYSISPTVYGRFNSDKVEANLRCNVGHSINKNNLADVEQSNNTDYRLTSSLKVRLPLDFALESTLNYSYRQGLGDGIKKDETMWNLAASKLLLKDKRGTLKFEFFDVLNDFRTQEKTISGNDYYNSWQKVVNNYFIFSFSYRFNII